MLSKTPFLLGSALLMALPLGAILPGCGGGAFSATQSYNSTLSLAPGQVALLSLRVRDGVASGTLQVSEKSAIGNKTAARKAKSHKIVAGEDDEKPTGEEEAGEEGSGGEPTGEEATSGEPTGEEPTGTPIPEDTTGVDPEATPDIQTATGGGGQAFSFLVPAGTYSLSGTCSSSRGFTVSGDFPGSRTFTVVGQIPAQGGTGDYRLTSGGETVTGSFKTGN